MSELVGAGRQSAAVYTLVSKLAELREEHAKGREKLQQAERYAAQKAEAIADVEAALRTLGVDPAEVQP